MGDLNSDGHLDLVIGSGSTTTTVFLGVGDGTFAGGVPYFGGQSSAIAD